MNELEQMAGYGTHLRKSRDQLVARVKILESLIMDLRDERDFWRGELAKIAPNLALKLHPPASTTKPTP